MAVDSHRNNNLENSIDNTNTNSEVESINIIVKPENDINYEEELEKELDDSYTSSEDDSDDLYLDLNNINPYEKFLDIGEVSDWAEEAARWAVNNGILKGREETKLMPKKHATREEVVTLIYRMFKMLENMKVF